MSSEGLYLSEAHAITAAGEGIAAAAGALESGLSMAARHPSIGLPGRDGGNEPPLYVPAVPYEEIQRIESLVELLIEGMVTAGAGSADAVWLLLPGVGSPRGGRLDTPALRALVDEALGCSCRVTAADQGLVPAIATLEETVRGEDLRDVWLIGADSLLDFDSLMALDERVGVQRESIDGVTPGEAAVALRLSRTPGRDDDPRLAGWHTATQSASEAEGLITAIREATARASTTPGDVDRIFADDGGDTATALVWHEANGPLWPRRPSPEQHHAMELGMIDPVSPPRATPPIHRPARQLGAPGVAGPLLQLALARAIRDRQKRWSAFGLDEPAATLLVCERLAGADDHALVLT